MLSCTSLSTFSLSTLPFLEENEEEPASPLIPWATSVDVVPGVGGVHIGVLVDLPGLHQGGLACRRPGEDMEGGQAGQGEQEEQLWPAASLGKRLGRAVST